MTEAPESHGESLAEVATFLSRVEAFRTLAPTGSPRSPPQ